MNCKVKQVYVPSKHRWFWFHMCCETARNPDVYKGLKKIVAGATFKQVKVF